MGGGSTGITKYWRAQAPSDPSPPVPTDGEEGWQEILTGTGSGVEAGEEGELAAAEDLCLNAGGGGPKAGPEPPVEGGCFPPPPPAS